MTDADRLELLEFKVAHLERGLQELSDVIVRQQQEIERVMLRNQQLLEQLESLEEPAGDARTAVEIPPHY